MKITGYEALCNLGNNVETIYKKAINGNITCFDSIENCIKDDILRAGIIKTPLKDIEKEEFNIRCNKLILKNLELLNYKITELNKKYSKNEIAIIVATTNSGVEEYEKTKSQIHSELGNPSCFIKETLGLKNIYLTVSTACSSGIKAFILANDFLNANVAKAVIVACVDSLSKVPVYGFNSLEVLSNKASLPFSKNRSGMNMGEACTIFIVEKDENFGIKVMGLAENTDIYHPTTPDPNAYEATNAIKSALSGAKLEPKNIDYINAHGTGTTANDIMEARAIYNVFSSKVPVSSTKPMTGHCLGAGAGIEIALCLKLIENFDGRLYPNVYDDCFDNSLARINLVERDKKYPKCDIVMCNSFGFGGTNAIMIMGKDNE